MALIRSIKASPAVGPLAFFAVVCIVLKLCSPAATTNASDKLGQGQHLETSSSIKPPHLFDFVYYQQRFGKGYGSKQEAVVHHAIFQANALKVYNAAMAYVSRQRGHYLAVNHLSDRSVKELELMENQVSAGNGPGERQEMVNDIDERLAGGENSKVEVTTERISDKIEYVEEINLKDLMPEVKLRQKREAVQHEMEPRRLSMELLIQGNGPVAEPAEVLAKWDRHPTAENPNYDEFKIEQISRGLVDQQERVPLYDPELDNIPLEDLNSWVKSVLRYEPMKYEGDFLGRDDTEIDSKSESENQERDKAEMFVDLRKTGCLFQPRNQGTCGACYIFAGIAMAEFLYCRKTGKLVQFSEQYLLDCGKDHVANMDGCSGGSPKGIATFVHNFGLEFGRQYFYKEREKQCPYDEETDLKTTGAIRMEWAAYSKVPVQLWPELLSLGPIYVTVGIPSDFQQYAGGVHDGQNCREQTGHAMVVVGHGREDGQEFWLLRNSYGPHWGEGGYFKLARLAPGRCLKYLAGFVFGTSNAMNYIVSPSENLSNSPTVLERLEALNRKKYKRRKIYELIAKFRAKAS